MQLSIVIINYNTFQLTSNCIKSIYQKLIDLEFEIILVDNASSECDANLFKEEFSKINLIKSSVNTGFAGGNNIGIAQSKGDYILLLNSDTELLNNAPKICFDYISSHKDVGLVTCQLQYPNGELQYNCRKFRTISWELSEVIPLIKLFPNEHQGKKMLHHYFNHQTEMDCDWVWGTFMLFSKKILLQLPQQKLATDFFMYCEDVLWCWQIKQLGYKIHFLPQAKIMHIHKASADKNKLLQVKKIGIKNHAIFMKKFYPNFAWYIWASIYYAKQNGTLMLQKLK